MPSCQEIVQRRDFLRIAFGLALGAGTFIGSTPLLAQEKKKKNKKSKIDTYSSLLPDNFVYLSPYQVSNLINGRLEAARITLAIEASTQADALILENKKREIDEVIYPLVLELFEKGPPSGADLIVFKRRARDQLQVAFESVENVFVRDIM